MDRLKYHFFMQVRVGGVIVIDNVLWHGKVADPLVSKYISSRKTPLLLPNSFCNSMLSAGE